MCRELLAFKRRERLRRPEALAAVIEAGAARAIIGSAALDDPAFLSKAVELYGEKIAVGIDARDGFVQTRGWVETTRVKAADLAAACRRRSTSRT